MIIRFTPTCVGNTHPMLMAVKSLGSPPRAWGIRAEPGGRIRGGRFTPTCVGNTRCCRLRTQPSPVHPHVRGEYFQRQGDVFMDGGSPPRAWGIPIINNRHVVILRFTPTCVGNTAHDLRTSHADTVHPHVRGEYYANGAGEETRFGSPPRAWGIHRQPRQRLHDVRFTPTCVGNTAEIICRVEFGAVHPHVRGEYRASFRIRCHLCGSPPRAWGIHGASRGPWGMPRFTPTCVGNTFWTITPQPEQAVHPHVRGEYDSPRRGPSPAAGSPPRAWGILHRFRTGVPVAGSPPRAWGIPCELALMRRHRRFTPTCVGNTAHDLRTSHANTVHPHVRGEYSPLELNHLNNCGSPPRAWGILEVAKRDGWTPRFTPTCVGNTQSTVSPSRSAAVHPHVRGEYGVPDARRTDCAGSPPRAWGIRRHSVLSSPPTRFTPTCVGNTLWPRFGYRFRAVHPHVRGEYAVRYRRDPSRRGSPPRAWGIRAPWRPTWSSRRFTPTCVGNTRRICPSTALGHIW